MFRPYKPIFIPTVCGAAAWRTNVKIEPLLDYIYCDTMKSRWYTGRAGKFILIVIILTAIGIYLSQQIRIIHIDNRLLLIQFSKARPELPVTFTPMKLSMSQPEVVNPLRGLYEWRGHEIVPVPEVLPQSAYDTYQRYTWRQLEPAPGAYDFSSIEADADQAAAEGRKHAFRVRALVARNGVSVPDYLVEQMPLGWWHAFEGDDEDEPDTYVPDWNDPDFIEAADRLIKALGARYNGDPRIAWIDIGIYGNWGEWHMDTFPYPGPTDADDMTGSNRRRLIDMHMAAFPDSRLIAMSSDADSLLYALQQSPDIGWRRDSLGHVHFESIRLRDPEAWPMIRDRWQIAPVITEFIAPDRQSDPATFQRAIDQIRHYHVSLVSNGNTSAWRELSESGRSAFIIAGKTAGYRLVLNQITVPFMLMVNQPWNLSASWSNVGVSPVYEEWEIVYQLRTRATYSVVWEDRSTLDLQTLTPTIAADGTDIPVRSQDTFQLPATLPPGDYTLTMVVRDATGYRQPLALAIEGRSEDGFYHLGTVKVY